MVRYTYRLGDHAVCGEPPCKCTNLALFWVKLATFLLSAVSSDLDSAEVDTVRMLVLDLSEHVVQNKCDSLIVLLLAEVH